MDDLVQVPFGVHVANKVFRERNSKVCTTPPPPQPSPSPRTTPPFNPETTIRFDLPQSQDIELAIYNLAAQRVATLVQGHREAGSYSVRWDGVDDAGLELASGVYFYPLTAGERVETRKLLLLR